MNEQDVTKLIHDYRHKVESAMATYMEKPLSKDSGNTVTWLMGLWDKVDDVQTKMDKHCCLSKAEAEEWCGAMVNDDGTTGPHWTMDQTTSVAGNMPFADEKDRDHNGITKTDWWVTMNMMYSDYHSVGVKFDKNDATFYAALAYAFLNDTDAPSPGVKLANYYRHIARNER